MKAHTGCEAVMIGRAAIGNPWIFGRLQRDELSNGEIVATIQYHLREMGDYYGEKLGLLLFRKHLKHYLAEMPEAQALLPQMLQSVKIPDLQSLLEKIVEPAHANLSTRR